MQNVLKNPHLCQWRLKDFVNNLNPVSIKDVSHYLPKNTHKKENLYVQTQNTIRFKNENPRAFGAHIKMCSEILNRVLHPYNFKKFIKTWPEPKYKFIVCKWEWNFLLNMILVMRNTFQRHIRSPVKHLRWSFLQKQLMT